MWAWQAGRIAGIDIKIHVTFPLVLVWALWEFGGLENRPFALFGMGLILLLFGCVLLHELGHALVARALGVVVEDITLLPIGGLAKFRTLRDNPREELAIALAGPLVNVVLAMLLFPVLLWMLELGDPGLLARVARRTGSHELWVAVLLLGDAMRHISLLGALAYLFFANLMLALFNLLPAFPMDGGRVLRALLALPFPYRPATVVAVRLGQLMGLLFLLAGFRLGLGMMFVGLFVLVSGNAELQRVALREVLVGGRVGSYMLRVPHQLSPEWSVMAARLLAQQTGQRAFPVVSAEGALVGLLTVREMHQQAPSLTVGQAMIDEFAVLGPACTLYDAQLLLQEEDQFAAAIMEGGTLLGLLSLEDIERAYHSLRRHPQPAPLAA